ncbi:MAG TPA: phosphatase PAP2 family protein [Gaiellaceae bacterium]|nr:phosphatase PAP2 family protein [Gaiellaceae bacterium]
MIGVLLAFALRRPRLLLPLVLADLAAEGATDILKALIPRHRPFVRQLGGHLSTHSFPSGHTATSFACATVLAAFAPRLRIPLYVLAAAVAYSRLYNGVHFPLDVVAGAVLGTATALLLLSGLRRGSRRAPRAG